jgi:hypothetical protein
MAGFWFSLLTYCAMGFIGLPLLLLCAWRRWLSLWHAAAVGAITGLLPSAAIMLPQLFDHQLHLHYRLQQLAYTTSFILLGVVAGVLFWAMAIWRNPHFHVTRLDTSAGSQ